MRDIMVLVFLAVFLTLPLTANAQDPCSCASVRADISALSTEVAQMRQALLRVTLKAGKTEAKANQTAADFAVTQEAVWPAQRRGREQFEALLTSVETEHGIPPVPVQ